MALVFLAPTPRRFQKSGVSTSCGNGRNLEMRPRTFGEPEELADALHADEAAMRRAFLASVNAMRAQLGDELSFELLGIMADEFDRELSERSRQPLTSGYLRGAAFARDRLPGEASLSVSFNLVNPKAVQWADQHAAAMVTQVGGETRTAIRSIIREALNDGASPGEVTRRIRDLIGLTERDALAVGRLRTRLEEEGRSDDQIGRLTKAYADRLLRRRAQTIARHETMQAANQGQRGLWQQAADDGLLLASEWERRWMIARDERTCAICRPLDGKRAPMLTGSFPGGITGPPIHVQCRCVTGLVRKS